MLLHASTDQKQPTPGWCPEAEEIQQQVNERFKDYPEVAQNFRAFVQNGHVAITQSRATGKK
jgi:histone deacetylase complex regulatory component SIN3